MNTPIDAPRGNSTLTHSQLAPRGATPGAWIHEGPSRWLQQLEQQWIAMWNQNPDPSSSARRESRHAPSAVGSDSSKGGQHDFGDLELITHSRQGLSDSPVESARPKAAVLRNHEFSVPGRESSYSCLATRGRQNLLDGSEAVSNEVATGEGKRLTEATQQAFSPLQHPNGIVGAESVQLSSMGEEHLDNHPEILAGIAVQAGNIFSAANLPLAQHLQSPYLPMGTGVDPNKGLESFRIASAFAINLTTASTPPNSDKLEARAPLNLPETRQAISLTAFRLAIQDGEAQVTLRDTQLTKEQASKTCDGIVQQLTQMGISAKRVYANGVLLDWLSERPEDTKGQVDVSGSVDKDSHLIRQHPSSRFST